jgi:hypothetical protein
VGSIPLVALNVKAPEQQPDLLQKYGQLQQLKIQGQQAQLQQQEAPLRLQQLQQGVQQGGIQLQQAQQQQKDSQALTAAMQEYDGKDINSLAPLVLKNGGSATAVMGLKKQIQEQQQQAATTFKAQADGGKAVVEAAKQKGDMIVGALSPFTDSKQVPDANLPQALTETVQSLVQRQLLDPPAAQKALQLAQSGDPNAIRQGIDQFSKTLLTHTQILDQAHQQAMESNQQAERDQAAANAKETQNYHQQEIGVRKQGLSIENARLAFDKAKEANSGAGPDGAGLVDSIGTGKIAVDRLGYLVAKNPGLLEAVSQKYPDFDSTKAGAYVNAYKDFTSTKTNTAGGALNAGGTALGHLKELKDMNTVASHIPGTPAHNAYMNKVDTVATELAKFYGDSTVSGIDTIRKTLASNLPGTRDAAIATQAQSMGDKFDAYQQSWDNAAPSKAYEAPMPGISEKATEARAALDPKFHADQVSRATKAPAIAPSGTKVGTTKTFPNGKTGTWDGTGWVAQ